MTDDRGLPLRISITPGQVHDSVAAADLLDGIEEGHMLLGDKAYDADWIRQMVAERGG